MRFEFATAARIVFGEGALLELPARIAELSHGEDPRVLVVTGRDPCRHATTLEAIERAGISCSTFAVSGEPGVELARQATAACLERGARVVVGLGGGSAIDLGKAVAALAGNAGGPGAGDPLAHLEVVGRGLPLHEPSLPFIAAPTTAGTGAEVTRNAVLSDERSGVKASLRSAHMLPRVALVDPLATHSVPPDVTAATGMDALTQVIEPFVSNAATPLTDAWARDAIARSPSALRAAFADGSDAAARRELSLVSLLGGLCLANAKLGAVHGFAGPLGGTLGAPHGAICARLLPLVIEANVRAMRARAPAHPALDRYDEVGRLLTGRSEASADDAIEVTRALAHELGIAPLRQYGLDASQIESIVQASARASSMKGNPIELEARELSEILERALD